MIKIRIILLKKIISNITPKGEKYKGKKTPNIIKNHMEKKLDETNKDILLRLLEYSKYLHEEEKVRTERIEKKVSIFTMFLGGSFWGILTLLPIEKLSKLSNGSVLERQIAIIVSVTYYTSFILFLFSAIFILLVYKVRNFEWLCDPEKRIPESAEKDEHSVLDTIIADYVITANRNHEINDKKAKWLSKAIFSLLIGLIFLGLSLFTFNVFILWRGVY